MGTPFETQIQTCLRTFREKGSVSFSPLETSNCNLSSHTGNLVLILRVCIDQYDIVAPGHLRWDVNALRDDDVLVLLDRALVFNIVVPIKQFTNVDVPCDYGDLTTVVETQLDGHIRMCAFVDLPGDIAGSLDGESLSTGIGLTISVFRIRTEGQMSGQTNDSGGFGAKSTYAILRM